MEVRYVGFDQLENARGYRFELARKGDTTLQFVVTVDLALFRAYGVGIQEGPRLCAQKLAADLEKCSEGTHELTTEDLGAYADARVAEEARKIESRKAWSRRPKAAASDSPAPWQRSRP